MINKNSIIKGSGSSRTVTIDGKFLDPLSSQYVYNHSPDGFNWGYGGSGPSQLALALLLNVMEKDKALIAYQDFKWDVVVGLPKDFELKGSTILDWIDSWEKSKE